MGWFSREGRRDEGEPTLVEAWGLLGARLGLQVSSDDERRVRAVGVVSGRPVAVSIEGRQRGTELLQAFSPTHRHRVHERWQSEMSVGCRNAAGPTGRVESFVDANAPGWQPGNFDPSHGRVVRASSDALAAAITPSIRERLMVLIGDVVVDVGDESVRVSSDRKASLDGSWFVGVPFHVDHPGRPQPWPERALAGPIWWIELLGDLAAAVEAIGSR